MHSYLVSLRISGDTLDPSTITSELGIEPTQIRRKGQPRGRKTVWDESMWEYEAKPTSGEREWQSLEEGLQAILSMFVSHHRILREYQQWFKVFLFCGHFTSSFDGGPTLSPALLEGLGEFGIELFLDTHCCDEPSAGS
jgi:Domain of unknown function (DUF4279)